MKKIISEINNILSQKTQINPKDICICGFSGGQDSVLLLIILLHLKKQWNIKIQLVYFHHFWQQKNFFSTYQIWYLSFIFKNPIYIITSEVFLNTEKKARQWRQQGFQRISDLEKSNKILTGHTASDRIETALWHLIRGTSPQGLISLKWETNLLAQTEYFNFPNFFIFDSFETKKLHEFFWSFSRSENEHEIKKDQKSPVSQSLKKLPINKSKISKIKFIYKKSKNKKTFRNCFSFVTPQEKQWVFNLKKNIGSFVSLKKLIKIVLLYPIIKKKYKRNIYKKNKKTIQTFSFLIFNSSMLTMVYFQMFFNMFFQKKHILRPLLVLHRNDITFFSKKYFLPIVCDPSNQKIRWSRNRIWHQLVPVLRFFFNPNTECLLNNFLEISIQEQKYIELIIKKIINYWLKNQNPYDIKTQLELLPKAIQRRLLQKIFQCYTNLQPNLVQIEILRKTSNKNF